MDAAADLVFGLVMIVGLAGVILPVLPGLLLIWLAALVWAIMAGVAGAWWVFAAMTVVLGAGTALKYLLPGRSLQNAGAPVTTLALGVLGAIVGFFAIPVVGVVVGGLLGVWLAELARLHEPQAAWNSTWATLKAIGVGMLLEFAAGFVAFGIWIAGAALT